MKYTIPVDKKSMAYASTTDKISDKSALAVAQKINGMMFLNAKKILQEIVDGKKSLRGRFFTKSAKGMLNLLESAENNAVKKNLDLESLRLNISVHKGANIHRSRRKRGYGTKMKMTNMQIILITEKKQEEKEEEKK